MYGCKYHSSETFILIQTNVYHLTHIGDIPRRHKLISAFVYIMVLIMQT